MLHRLRLRNQLPGWIVLISVAAGAHAEEFKIALSRPETVGSSYTISAIGSFHQSSTFTMAGKEPQKQDKRFAVQIEGSIKNLEIDDKTHLATKLELTVAKCVRDGMSFFEPGTVITAENKDGRTAYSVAGMSVALNDATALGLVFSTYRPGEPTDSDMFGSDKPQQVGGSWPINTNAAAFGANKNGVPVTKDQIQGRTTLLAMKKVDDVQVLEIEATMEVPQFSGILSNGPHVEHGGVIAHFSGYFPTDGTSRPLQTSQSTHMHIAGTVAGPNQQVASIDGDLERSNTIKYGQPGK